MAKQQNRGGQLRPFRPQEDVLPDYKDEELIRKYRLDGAGIVFVTNLDCRQPFNGGSFFDHEGMPYCETHYHAKRGSLCAGCNKPITGRCITAMCRKYHPEHFVCSFCLKQLNKGTFKEQNDKPYCHACFDKLFG